MFFEQLKRLCALKGTTPTAIVKKVGLSTSNVTSWKHGASPKTDILEKLAKELDVPVSAFFEHGAATKPQLQSDEEELLEVYRKLSQSGKRQLMGRAYELMDSQGSKQAGDEVTPPNFDLAASVLGRRVKK